MKCGSPNTAPKAQKLPSKSEARPKITVTEFMEWLQELAADPKWKNPTAWDEHTFRVGVQMVLKRVTPPNDKLRHPAVENPDASKRK